MPKISLTLSESKSKVNLTLEGKGTDKTWNTIGGTWDDHINSTWNRQRDQLTLESKAKDNLGLESK